METKNAGGGGNNLWTSKGVQGVTGGAPFFQYLGVKSVDHAPIQAHQKATVAVVVQPTRAGSWHWKGMRVYWDHSSKLIPTVLTVKAGPRPDQMKNC